MKMKSFKTLLILLPLFYAYAVHAQDNSIDSLQKILKNIPGLEKGIPGLDMDIPGLGNSLKNYTQQQLKEVFENLNKEVSAAKAMGDIKKLQGGYYELTKLDSTTGNYKQAYEHYKLYTLYRDSLIKEETEKKELQAKMQYEFDKKQAIAKAEQDKKDAEQKRIKNLQYFAIAALVCSFAGNFINCIDTMAK